MHITSIDQINMNELPIEVQNEIKSADSLEFRGLHGVQEILGRGDSKIIFCLAVTYKILSKSFQVWSYGSDKWQWSWMSGLRPS